MFAMGDTWERKDQLWGKDDQMQVENGKDKDIRCFLYLSSLPYLVSGVLESREVNGKLQDEADVPLLGLERFYTGKEIYSKESGFADVEIVRKWLDEINSGMVWSKVSGQAVGLNCDAGDHGAFNTDALMRASLDKLVREGF